MRMRKKKNLVSRLEKVDFLSVKNPADFYGNWRASFLKQAKELHVELGCGKGKFITQSAAENPDCLYIAVEKVPSVVLSAMETAWKLELKNIKFIIGDVGVLSEVFADGETDVVYLNFSDPWPNPKHFPRRLTHSSFLEMYRKILNKTGRLEFKTDNLPLFQFSVNELQRAGWILAEVTENLPDSPKNIMTEYEARFRALGAPICRLIAFP